MNTIMYFCCRKRWGVTGIGKRLLASRNCHSLQHHQWTNISRLKLSATSVSTGTENRNTTVFTQSGRHQLKSQVFQDVPSWRRVNTYPRFEGLRAFMYRFNQFHKRFTLMMKAPRHFQTPVANYPST